MKARMLLSATILVTVVSSIPVVHATGSECLAGNIDDQVYHAICANYGDQQYCVGVGVAAAGGQSKVVCHNGGGPIIGNENGLWRILFCLYGTPFHPLPALGCFRAELA